MERGEQYKTLVEIVEQDTSYRYYISQNDIEIGVNAYSIRDYGKYFKVDVSIINNLVLGMIFWLKILMLKYMRKSKYTDEG